MGILDEVLQQIDGKADPQQQQTPPADQQQQQPAPEPQQDSRQDSRQEQYDPNAKDANWYGDEFKRFAGIK